MIDWLLHLPGIIVVIPLLSAIIVALLPSRIGWFFASVSSGLSFWAALVMANHMLDAPTLTRISYFLGGWPPPWGIEFSVDHATTLVTLAITGLGFVTTLSSNALIFKDIHEEDKARFYAAWLLALGGLLGLVMTADAFNLFVFFEISSLASVTLVAMGSGRDKRALVAAFNYLIIGAIGATFYVIGVGFCYAMTGTLNMIDMASRLSDVTDPIPV
ncbi:MAG: proton-conducting transporter membrane subunit, partial [Candidatus Puniceispirillales bacterium]